MTTLEKIIFPVPILEGVTSDTNISKFYKLYDLLCKKPKQQKWYCMKAKKYDINIVYVGQCDIIFQYKNYIYKFVIPYIDLINHNECEHTELLLKDVSYNKCSDGFIIKMPLYEITLLDSMKYEKNYWIPYNIETCIKEIGLFIINIHENNIIHNDIKIENIMFYNKKWIIIDYGHSCKVNDTPLSIMQNFGTKKYRPRHNFFLKGIDSEKNETHWKYIKDWYSYAITMFMCFGTDRVGKDFSIELHSIIDSVNIDSYNYKLSLKSLERLKYLIKK